MGNSSTSFPRLISCSIDNLSSNSVTPEYWETSSISDAHRANSIATAVIMLLFLLVGLPANIIIIVSITYKKLCQESTTHLLLLNLAISDLLVCLLVMPFVIMTGFAGEYIFGGSDHTRCQVCKTILIFVALSVFSVNVIAFISLDRFIFIQFPLRYETICTLKRIGVGLIVLWLVSIFQSLIPLMGLGSVTFSISVSSCTLSFVGESKFYLVLLSGLALPSITIIVTTNIWIIVIVRKQIRTVYQTRRQYDNNEECNERRKKVRKIRNKKQVALMRTFGAILIGNFISWGPIIVHVFVTLFVDLSLIPLGFYTFVLLTFFMHSIIHPLVEACFIPEIRNTFKTFLGIIISACLNLIRRQQNNVVRTDIVTASDPAFNLTTDYIIEN